MRSSTSPSFDRRAALALGAAACAAVLGVGSPADAQQPPVISGISVDVRPLEAKGLNGFADALGAAVHRQLAAQFAGSLTRDRRAPVLYVRLTGISMTPPAGPAAGRGGRGGGGAESDFLEGSVSLGGQSFPLLVQQYSGMAGDYRRPEVNDRRRFDALAFAFAQWTRRKLGG